MEAESTKPSLYPIEMYHFPIGRALGYSHESSHAGPGPIWLLVVLHSPHLRRRIQSHLQLGFIHCVLRWGGSSVFANRWNIDTGATFPGRNRLTLLHVNARRIRPWTFDVDEES